MYEDTNLYYFSWSYQIYQDVYETTSVDIHKKDRGRSVESGRNKDEKKMEETQTTQSVSRYVLFVGITVFHHT